MHMGLESFESALKSASFDTKITSIADWEHVEPENTIHCNGIVSQWRSLHSTQLTPFTFDEIRSEHEQTMSSYIM